MEVHMALLPMGTTQAERDARFLNLTRQQATVNVGRSSKNPLKGLQPASDNAIFDCPIMSRQHAQFSAMPETKVGAPKSENVAREVIVKDCGSTHGTYIDGRRLQSGKRYALKTGETVTFGIQVTNGPQVHLAKAFRVNYVWSGDSPARTGFRVPDEEQDSVEDHSREGSIQIIETRPHTYSVPSSDDEIDSQDEEIEMSSVRANSVEVSAATIPSSKSFKFDGKKSGKDEAGEDLRRSPNPRGPSLQDLLNKSPNDGSSQQNPIDLEDVSATAKHVDDTESEASEDDEPVALPVKPNTPTTADVPSIPPRPQRPQTFHNQSEADRAPTIKDVVLETQAHTSVSNANATDGDDSCDENNAEELDSFGGEPCPWVRREAIRPAETPLDQHPSILPSSGGSIKPSLVLGQSVGPTDVSRPKNDQSSTHRRPPSPSDAALAKTPINTSIPKGLFNGFKAYALPGSSALPRMRSLGSETGFGMPYYSESWNVYHADDKTDNVAKRDRCNEPFYKTSSLYARSHHDPAATSMSDRLPFGLADDGLDVHGTRFDYADTFLGHPMNGPVLDYNELPVISTPYHEPHTASAGVDSRSRHGASLQERPFSREPSSRLNISNLINESYTSNQRRAHKRKVDEMNSDDIASAANTGEAEQASPIAPAVDETQLPNAQIRDDPAVDAESSISPDKPNEPLVSSVTTMISATDIETLEPPRKKAKTASSTSKVGGIAKFLSGVCVGVVGVLATIIATVPASVQEEALREVTNLA
ncbi:MAG: hypothetical protein Q9217_002582 [Psora testacea]